MPRHILIALSAEPVGLPGQLEEWSKTHVEHMLEIPTFTTAQSFRVHPRHNFAFPETRATRPPYTNLCVYDLDEDHLEEFLNPDPSGMDAPQPPGGVGPHMPDGYLFVATSPEYRK